jgi:hypothetical protein
VPTLSCVGQAPSTTTPTPPSSPTASPIGCPVDAELCDFATLVSRAVVSSDIDALMAHIEAQPFECPGPPPPGLGGPYPLCDTSRPGERRVGYPFIVFQSEGSVRAEAGARAMLQRIMSTDPSRSDQFGPGAMRLFTIGCPGRPPSCSQRFAIVFSGIQQLPNVPNPFRSRLDSLRPPCRQRRCIDTIGIAGNVFEPALLRGGPIDEFLWSYGTPPIPSEFYSVR